MSLVRQALAYRRTDGAIIKLGDQIRLSVKIGEPVWARVNDETLCTPDAIDLDGLAELERHGVSLRKRAGARTAGRIVTESRLRRAEPGCGSEQATREGIQRGGALR